MPVDPHRIHAYELADDERWVSGYEGRYFVTVNGDVMSLVGWTEPRRVQPRINNRGGYLMVELRKDGNGTNHPVHTLVLLAFVGPRPEGDYQAAHENGRPSDNRLSNLSWKTRQENMDDMLRHGTRPGTKKVTS